MDVFLSILPIFFIFFIFYFLVIRPQSRAEARRKELIRNLKRGDVVYTSGGLVGKVWEVGDKTVTVEVAKDVRVKLIKDTIQGLYLERVEEEKAPEKPKQKDQKEQKEK